MRSSQFWEWMSQEFGEGYARTLAGRHHLQTLGDRTPDEALEAGVPPRAVWEALCVDLDVPPDRRLGPDVRPRRPGR